VWSFDEHRLGLQPILRKVWSLRGHRPVVKVEQRYQWLYLYGFVSPQSGRTFWLLLPQVNTAIFNIALQELAGDVGAGPDKHILLVMDGAGWHTSQEVAVPLGIHLIQLPPYSAELQPAEKLWPLSNEGSANRHFSDLDELEEAQVERCRSLLDQPALISSYTLFSWWPTVAF
jgi:DDE superfamily endonuclease